MTVLLLILFLCLVLSRKRDNENPPRRGTAREFWGF